MKNKYFLAAIIPTIFSILLLIFRVNYTGNEYFVFMLWNLLLAWIPFLIILLLKIYYKKINRFFKSLIIITWLLFLPNTFYILTDFIHLRSKYDIGLWFDLIMIAAFVFSGMLLGFLSLDIFHKIIDKTRFRKISWILIVSTIFLSSFGIYLGRFLRWNSWDILTNPGDLAGDVLQRIINPFDNLQTYAVTLILGVFLFIIYFIFWIFIKDEKVS